MADRVQSDKFREINPNFSIPEGLSVFGYAEISEEGGEADFDVVEVEYIGIDDFESAEDSEENYDSEDETPPVPEIYGVVAEEILTGPDGSQVVNITLEVEDIEAMTQFDIRFTA